MRKKYSLFLLSLLSLLSFHTIAAQKTLADYSIVDDCTYEAVGFEADLSPLFDKNDLTVFTLPQLTGTEEIILKARRPFVMKGFSVVSADDANRDLKQLQLLGSTDGETWQNIRTYSLSYTGRYRERQVNGGPSTAFTAFKLVLKSAMGSEGLRIAEFQLFGYPQEDSDNIATTQNGTISGSAKAGQISHLIDNDPRTMTQIQNADRQLIDNFNGETRYNGLQNAWFQYEFNEPTTITGYAIGMTSSAQRDLRPNCWELLASNDGEQWVTLDVQHNAASMAVDYYEQRYHLTPLSSPEGNTNARKSNEAPSGAVGGSYAYVADRMMDFCEQELERKQSANGTYWICDWAVDPAKRNEDWGGYWWAAHGVDNYVDQYNRTQQSSVLTKLTHLVNGTRIRNGNTLINHFYDDMEWMALALLRACDANSSLNHQYMTQVKTLFNDIVKGWDDVDGGGIHWNKNTGGDGATKNACSNCPAMILAARLYQHTQEQQYLDWAIRIYEYMRDHCRFPDGVMKDTPQNNNHEVTFSYNQGTWVGGLLELYKITGEEHYRQTATDLMDLLLFGKWYSPKGIMNERQNYNQDDGGLFKGIFIRYLAQWILSGRLDTDHQVRYTKWLLEQARSAELAALDKTWFIVNPYWTQQYNINTDVHDTSRQQSGLMLMEAVDELRRAGLLTDDYALINPNAGKPYRYYRLVITETQNSGSIMLGAWKLFGNETSGIKPVKNSALPTRPSIPYDLHGRLYSRVSNIIIKNNKKYFTR
ncbi:MAG: AGE family epimerase/isomerase [Prevotella sp.]|nr:AGE family epimerase/isomerase [Prevotella sp.]